MRLLRWHSANQGGSAKPYTESMAQILEGTSCPREKFNCLAACHTSSGREESTAGIGRLWLQHWLNWASRS